MRHIPLTIINFIILDTKHILLERETSVKSNWYENIYNFTFKEMLYRKILT